MTSISPGVVVVCDLDGCLIPFDGEWEKRLIERIKEFLDLHPESEFRVLSSRNDVPDVIADIGLGEALDEGRVSIIEPVTEPIPGLSSGGDWFIESKGKALQRLLDPFQADLIIWIDDDLNSEADLYSVSDMRLRFASNLGARVISPDPSVGLTVDQWTQEVEQVVTRSVG